jgi:hypothetical protein
MDRRMQGGRVRDEKLVRGEQLVRDVHFHGGHVVMVSGLGDCDDLYIRPKSAI